MLHASTPWPWLACVPQGDRAASQFYVLEEGTCNVFVAAPGTTAPEKVHVYYKGRCAAAGASRHAWHCSSSSRRGRIYACTHTEAEACADCLLLTSACWASMPALASIVAGRGRPNPFGPSRLIYEASPSCAMRAVPAAAALP